MPRRKGAVAAAAGPASEWAFTRPVSRSNTDGPTDTATGTRAITGRTTAAATGRAIRVATATRATATPTRATATPTRIPAATRTRRATPTPVTLRRPNPRPTSPSTRDRL